MKKLNTLVGLIVTMVLLLSLTTSCEQEAIVYQAKVRNSCQIYLLGTSIPFMKYEIVDMKVGDISSGPVAYNTDSEYFNVESGVEYLVTLTYDIYYYDTETFAWEFDRTVTDDLGTETWTRTEDSDKFIMKVEMGDLLSAYAPYFETYIAN
ncbi:MAG: hypothetical protein K9I34_02780 [Bacteroidales bacterium]|nr:hypothetical protein [Bacteroidales bacterium]